MEKKIGYTQGTFDMFHIGHLNLIRNAKKHCDYLIVGVNADDLVELYKNKRPIVPLEERAEIVRAIRYVDEVHAGRHAGRGDRGPCAHLSHIHRQGGGYRAPDEEAGDRPHL